MPHQIVAETRENVGSECAISDSRGLPQCGQQVLLPFTPIAEVDQQPASELRQFSGSGALSVVLSEEDAVAKESKACSSVHLPFDQLCFGVHAFGASVVVFEGDRGGDGVDVLVDASGEGVHVR